MASWRRSVEPADATTITPSTSDARITGSLTGNTGGESRITRSTDSLNASNDAFVRSPASSSDAFGGIGPDVITASFVGVGHQLGDLTHRRLAEQHRREPQLVRQVEEQMGLRLAEIAVDQQHPLTRTGRRDRQVRRRRRLALAGARARDEQRVQRTLQRRGT